MKLLTRLAVLAYLLLFFAFLLGPLIIMAITAFNSSTFPRVLPWECLTFEWFGRLANDSRVLEGLQLTAIIGVFVVILSLLLGLAGALLLTQIFPRARATYYTIVTSPILMPGIVIGISTVLFWDRVAHFIGLGRDSVFYHGIFLTVLGQSSFIASYCMLVFIARLQRFDEGQIEAALDLGATHVQAFRRILLPFLRPAIFSAAVIAFLASFENYNTSVFTLGHFSTFTVVIAQKVRLGLDPSISALAVIIITATLFLALLNEAYSTHAERHPGRPLRALLKGGFGGFFAANPAAILAVLMLAGVAGTVLYASRHDPAACKAEVLRKKLEIQQRYARPPTPQTQPGQKPPAGAPGRSDGFGGVFNPQNLQNAPGAPAAPPAPAPAPPQKPRDDGFGGVFNPQNLQTAPSPGQ
ncbi:MAG: ABC transporter permease subunit [Aestuariivirgaceae bacterium]